VAVVVAWAVFEIGLKKSGEILNFCGAGCGVGGGRVVRGSGRVGVVSLDRADQCGSNGVR
jgi:hypothetical protein